MWERKVVFSGELFVTLSWSQCQHRFLVSLQRGLCTMAGNIHLVIRLASLIQNCHFLML